jgi:UDP-N-acetylmuramoylalanine--D-glutamate ligase
MKNDIIQYLRNKSILILGYGREGRAALEFVRENLPDNAVAVADKNPVDIEGVLSFSGADYLRHCHDFDIVIKSPGVEIKDFIDDEDKEKITSLSDLFLCFCQNPIIGITGTKGKSTTSSLVYHILTSCGKKAVLTGNIGQPCFEVIDKLDYETIVVFELSCHQLEFVKASPHIAILLNLYEEHFDHYAKPEHYFRAKKNIYRYQTSEDILIYGDIFEHATKEEIDALDCETIDIHSIDIKDDEIETTLLGEHNYNDIRAAVRACQGFGLSKQQCLEAVKSFRGLPHRLEYVGKFEDIDFYNDSIATAQEATINAVQALGNVNTIILGGMDRGISYEHLVDFLRDSSVRNVILLPNTTKRFMDLFNSSSYKQRLFAAKNMEEAVDIAFRETEKGKICLLSPAAASYGFYKDFQERGEDYCAKIQNHKNA